MAFLSFLVLAGTQYLRTQGLYFVLSFRKAQRGAIKNMLESRSV
jgi:hypothetical protein